MKCCCVCKIEIVGRYKQAKYCSNSCKYQANRKLDSIQNYATSIHGRAVALWHNSKARHSLHTISVEFIENKLSKGYCEVTGIEFEFSYGKGKTPFSPSLDQIIPGVGYTEENTRVVVWIYNAAKNSFTDNDVLKMATALVNKDGSVKNQTSRRERKK